MQIFALVTFMERIENDKNDNLSKIHGDLYIASALMKTTNNDVIVLRTQQTLAQRAKATLTPLRGGFEQLYVYFVFKLYSSKKFCTTHSYFFVF